MIMNSIIRIRDLWDNGIIEILCLKSEAEAKKAKIEAENKEFGIKAEVVIL